MAGDASAATVAWSSEIEPSGVSEADAQAASSGAYLGGFGALLEKFGPA